MHPTRTCAGILKLLREQGVDMPGPDHHYRISRTRAGHWQRSAGAWSWALDWKSDDPRDPNKGRPYQAYQSIGSQWPASQCAKGGFLFDGETFTPP